MAELRTQQDEAAGRHAARELNTAIGMEHLARHGEFPGEAARALDDTLEGWLVSPPGRSVTELDDAVVVESPEL